MMPAIREPILALAIAAAGVGLTLRYSLRAGVVDIPNDRSSHTIPTPRGGGIALVLAVMVVSWPVLSDASLTGVVGGLLLAALALLAVVGWLDDKSHMPVAVRFPAHLFGALCIGVLVNAIHPLSGWVNIAWIAWWIFWTVASINIVNFMDGIDGMVGSQGVIYGLFLFAIGPAGAIGSRYGIVLAAACLGFLLWNWAPAKVFLGDVGSGPLGFLFVLGGALALDSARPAIVFLPLYPLFLDALLTLIGRARRGEKLTAAHRAHLYQRLANGGAGHALVTLAYALAAAVGALVGLVSRNLPVPALTLAIAAYLVLVTATWVTADWRESARLTRAP